MLGLTARACSGRWRGRALTLNGDALLLTAWRHTWAWTLTHPTWVGWAVLGLTLGGVTHSVADMVVSWFRRL